MHPEQRFHALDAVRAFALIAGIVLHGTMSFLPDLLSMKWPIADNSPSLTLEVAFYVIHVFRMSAFFLIAGFFAHLMFHRKGAREFIRDRARRIVGPMLAGWAILTPLTIGVIVWAAWKLSGGNLEALQQSSQGPQPTGVPLMHLWFLYYLVLFYAITLLFREAIVRHLDRGGSIRTAADRVMRGLVNGYVAPIVFAIPTAVYLYFTKNWEWIGVPTPDMGLTPKLPATISFGTAFVFGWLLHRQTALLATFEKRWALHLLLAIGATAAAWYIVGAPFSFKGLVPDDVKLLYAAVYTFAIWTWVFAILGTALKFFSGASRVRRYLADSSYWMYLLHLPLVFALQTVVMHWNLHWSIKFPLLLAMTFAILLTSYQWLVRGTWIGKWLNGRRIGREPELPAPAQAS